MEGDTYYIYVLKVSNGGYYVGSTKNLHKRLVSHFGKGGGGATGTRESKPIYIDSIYTIIDYKVGALYAHIIAEIHVASKYADTFGANLVRGAKHGQGWNDIPSASSLKIIKYVRKYMTSTDGIRLNSVLKEFSIPEDSYWYGKRKERFVNGLN